MPASFSILPYSPAYRDDVIFTVLYAKHAIGRTPRLNEDLLDIEGAYLARGDEFFVAVEDGRVIGCCGYNKTCEAEAKLHRLYVRPDRQRSGVGSALLDTVLCALLRRGVRTVRVHLGAPK